MALDHKDQKRTATIIAIEDTHFGETDRSAYYTSVKESLHKLKKHNIGFLINSHIFQDLLYDKFELNYFNLFAVKKISSDSLIIKSGDIPKKLYFIKSGKYEVSTKRSLNDVNMMIKALGGNVDESKEKIMQKNDPHLKKYFFEKHQLRLTHIIEKDIIGLEDIILNNEFFVDVICISYIGEIFELENKSFEFIKYKEPHIEEHYEKIVKDKKDIMLKKLLNFKSMKIDYYNTFVSKSSKLIVSSKAKLNITQFPKPVLYLKMSNKSIDMKNFESSRITNPINIKNEDNDNDIMKKSSTRWFELLNPSLKDDKLFQEDIVKDSKYRFRLQSMINTKSNIVHNDKLVSKNTPKVKVSMKNAIDNYISNALSTHLTTQNNTISRFTLIHLSDHNDTIARVKKNNSIDKINKLRNIKAKKLMMRNIVIHGNGRDFDDLLTIYKN
jgi:hypothetical protein